AESTSTTRSRSTRSQIRMCRRLSRLAELTSCRSVRARSSSTTASSERWQVGWILNYQSGTPMSGCSSSSVCESGSPFPNGFNRPDRNPSVKLSTASYSKVRDYFTHGGTGTGPSMFNPAGFTTTPTQYVIGNADRIYGDLRNPAYLMENLNARKHFYIGERWQAILQVDYFNAFNRTRFNGPDENASNGTFTQDTSTGSQINNRQGQLKLQILF